jgi:hypothetical protein
LRYAPAPNATVEEIEAGISIDHVLQYGWITVGESVVYAPAFLLGMTSLISALNGHVRWSGLDMADMETRVNLITQAVSLLKRWPQQFLHVSSELNWTAVDLALSRRQLPYWLHSVIKNNIDKSQVSISPNEAKSIYVQTLASVGSFTLSQARAVSGRTIDYKHLEGTVHRRVSDETFGLLLAHINYVASKELKPLEKLHIFSDKLIICLARVSDFKQSDIERYQLPQATSFATHNPPDFGIVPTTSSEVASWMGWYLRQIRPELKLPPQSTQVFVCRKDNRPLSENTFGERFRKYVRDAGLEKQIQNFRHLRCVI